MRELLLIRHGKAEAAAFGGDAARALTDDGRAGIASVGAGLAALGLRPDALWHSPYRRAVETAELLGRALGVARAATREEPLLVPGASSERAARALLDASARRLACVSHMPLLPELVGRLTGARVDFGTGAVAHLVLAGPHGATLIGLWSADLLARVR
ncbi:MAG: histidine phosphatase family protein [Deltaproteobacteria bacterium]|nr:histidine phosphatase family protein [Deltaproteobacteria bacterium]